MGVFFLEGFDAYDASVTFGSEAIAKNLLLSLIDSDNSDWFSGVGDQSRISTAETRIVGGKSLEMTRGGGATTWTTEHNAILGWGFLSKDTLAAGYSVKFSAQPTNAIPLLLFKGSTTSGEQEQATLWVSPDGKLFFASNSYNPIYSSSDPVNIIVPTSTEAGLFRFGVWQYVEVLMDYSGATPTASVHLNGVPVIENVADSLLKSIPSFGYISSMFIVNPCTDMFGSAYSMFIDDIYMRDSNSLLGPQHVMTLGVGSPTQNDWSGGGTLGANITNAGTGGVSAGDFNQRNEYPLDDLPIDAGAVNGIGVSVYGSSSATYNIVEFGIDGQFSKRANFETTAQLFRVVSSNVTLSHAAINGYDLFIHTREFTV